VAHEKQNISLSIISLMLIAFLAIPSVLKLMHISDHLVVDCENAFESHIHAKELDCDFNNFNISPRFYNPVFFEDTIAVFYPGNVFSRAFIFSIQSNIRSFSLRAPPLVA